MLRAGENIDLLTPANVYETGLLQHVPPLCFQQSTGDSAGPEIDVVFRILRHFLMNDDVGDLEAAAWLQHPEHLPHHRHLVRAEVDHAVANHDIDRFVVHRQLLGVAMPDFHVGKAERR